MSAELREEAARTGAASGDAATDSVRAAELIARIESVPFSRWHIRPRVIMGSATFFDAFTALSLASATPVLVQLWGLTLTQVGYLLAASYIGQFAGALIFGWLGERIGRVMSATYATLIMAVVSLACAFTGNFTEMFICRLIQGIGVGGEMPVAATYINELSRAHGRGRQHRTGKPAGQLKTGVDPFIVLLESGVLSAHSADGTNDGIFWLAKENLSA